MKIIHWDKDIAATYYRCFVEVSPQPGAAAMSRISQSRNLTISEVKAWCEENIIGNAMLPYHMAHWFFEDSEDAMAFKLRWC